MSQQAPVSVIKRFQAAVCRVYPYCLIAPRRATSALAKAFGTIQARCLFCRSDEQVRRIKVATEEPIERSVPVKFA